jgi:hypothetical protein
MPIEIKELIIRATVIDNTNNRQQQKQDIDLRQLKRELIQECITRLRKKKEQKNSR